MLEFMAAPFVASMLLVALLSYLGLHVIAREVIFVDLSLAQMAALGTVVALLYGVTPDSRMAFVFSLIFTCIGAALFAVTRTHGKGRVPHEAIIGIVYVVASAAAILVADRAPRGAEAMHDVLEGAIVWITWPTIALKGAVFSALGIIHFFLRRRFITISFRPEEAEQSGWRIRIWDFLFYLTFGVAVTLAVPVAGVLLVFTMLVVPAVVAFLFTRSIRRMMVISWGAGALASLLGLYVSYVGNFPTGPLIVCMYGIVLLGAGGLYRLRRGAEPAATTR